MVSYVTHDAKLEFFCSRCNIKTQTKPEDLCIESDYKPDDFASTRILLSAEDPARLLDNNPCSCGMPYRVISVTPKLLAFLVCPGCKTIEQYTEYQADSLSTSGPTS